MKEFLDEIEIDGRKFVKVNNGIDDGFEHAFRDFRIRVSVSGGFSMDGAPWMATMITHSGRHGLGLFLSPVTAAEAALVYWKDEIAESDQADAQDSERERLEFEREHKLTKRDVI